MTQKLLITGGRGYLGSNVIAHLEEDEFTCIPSYDIYTIGRKFEKNNPRHYQVNIESESSVSDFFNRVKPNIILHLAGLSSTRMGTKYPLQMVRTNINGTANLLQHCPEGCRFIFASSVLVYDHSDDFYNHPRKMLNPPQDMHFEEDEKKPNSLYGITKSCGEEIVNLYHRLGKINGTNMRLSAVVGGKNMSHGPVNAFINKAQSDSEKLEVLGEKPGSYRPLLYIQDFLDGLNIILKRQEIDVINICPTDFLSMQDIARRVMKTLNIEKEIKWCPEKNFATDVNMIKCSNSKFKSFGWQQRFSTGEAVTNTVKDILH